MPVEEGAPEEGLGCHRRDVGALRQVDQRTPLRIPRRPVGRRAAVARRGSALRGVPVGVAVLGEVCPVGHHRRAHHLLPRGGALDRAEDVVDLAAVQGEALCTRGRRELVPPHRGPCVCGGEPQRRTGVREVGLAPLRRIKVRREGGRAGECPGHGEERRELLPALLAEALGVVATERLGVHRVHREGIAGDEHHAVVEVEARNDWRARPQLPRPGEVDCLARHEHAVDGGRPRARIAARHAAHRVGDAAGPCREDARHLVPGARAARALHNAGVRALRRVEGDVRPEARRAALHDRPVEVRPRGLDAEQLRDGAGTRGLAEDGHARRVAAEGRRVLLDPLERGDVVEEAPISGRARRVAAPERVAAEETKGAEAVLHHKDDYVLRGGQGCAVILGGRAADEATAVDPDHDRARAPVGGGRVDVHVEAVLGVAGATAVASCVPLALLRVHGIVAQCLLA
mmetsp:Transcript_120775/g.376084  ORF Transcript_120775/g.376084 Transcript_120775/m.376084 type:complete len:459 (+) Transcript_120775:183-1559(+)